MQSHEMKIIFLLATIISLTISNKNINEHVCVNLKPKNNPIISKQIYRDLVRHLEWDLGQQDFKTNLTKEHNEIMKCIFLDGFSEINLVHCLGRGYTSVVEKYRVILKNLQNLFINGVMNYLEFQGYDNICLLYTSPSPRDS